MDDHARAIARDQIRHLIACYNNTADRGRLDEFVLLFAPDAVLELTHQRLEGREAIQRMLTAVATGNTDADLSGARHQLTTCRIEIPDEGDPQAWTYFFVSRRGTILEEGTYIDRFVRLPEGWRFAHRRVKMLYSVHHR